MAQIRVLSKETIDKIAAGEVVERPSSVVKELLENAVDAKASAVTVEIKEGGISFIRVTDNGCGIDRDQVPIAFVRHATSKIQTAEDLSHIVSLGFRGEALSSIAAVSRMELITKTPETLTGIRYLIEGGEEVETEEIGAPAGTTIIVRNLFFNTPVRKKFLKSPQTEGGYISDLMEHMAMANPHISFKYVNNGQLRFHTTGNGNLQEIIYRIYGKDISKTLVPVDIHEQGIHMYGFLGKPEINRANRNFEIYFINGRFIKSGIIGKAIEEGYRNYLMQHKFPFAVLHFIIHSEEIDVNVHPTKMEVRFTNQMQLYDFIETHVRETLHAIELIPETTLGGSRETKEKKEEQKQMRELAPEPFEAARFRNENIPPARRAVDRRAVDQRDVDQRMIKPKIVAEEDAYRISGEEEPFFVDNRQKEGPLCEKSSDLSIPTEKYSPTDAQVPNPVQINLFEEKMLTREARKEYRIMGQVFDTYWLIAFHDKLFIIDQHAAHEKVKYEKLMERLKNAQAYPQALNPPIIVTLSGKEENIYREYENYFMEMGFETETFGGNEYAIRSVPSDLYGRSGGELFTELLDELAEGPVNGAPDVIRQKIASMACKAAVKGNMAFDTAGIEELIDELLALEDPYHCPHGRPTIISMSKYELEKKFKRIV